ncbi:protein FAM204A isoform X1 [Labeo rohita]|uniref:Protein FAM204A isoform X1 n=1 Tax=Labeo rohita TaxID=84645 RepID=A0A498L671_LABRO|nr:protein FAM204A isoform X1 [Labeo rohita]RXN28289.1 protein FAM204A isoform X1 [Labeo rohita]
MYSGLLPPGLSEADLSSDDADEEVTLTAENRQGEQLSPQTGGTQKCDIEQEREPKEKQEGHWKELTQYFGINDRLKPPPCNRPPLMSGLEKSIESSIAEGDYGKAEELSDRLATREKEVLSPALRYTDDSASDP